MTSEQLAEHVKPMLEEYAESVAVDHGEVVVSVAAENLLDVCTKLRNAESPFDYFSFMTAIDRGETFELVYRLRSFALNAEIFVTTSVPREKPEIDSVVPVWEGADWHERECYDLFGVTFRNHPDLRRILLPDDWDGYPLRKDYVSPHEREPDGEKDARLMLAKRADALAEQTRAARPEPAPQEPESTNDKGSSNQ